MGRLLSVCQVGPGFGGRGLCPLSGRLLLGHLGQSLGYSRAGLLELREGLCGLLVHFGNIDERQQLVGTDAVADVHEVLTHVSAAARLELRGLLWGDIARQGQN